MRGLEKRVMGVAAATVTLLVVLIVSSVALRADAQAPQTGGPAVTADAGAQLLAPTLANQGDAGALSAVATTTSNSDGGAPPPAGTELASGTQPPTAPARKVSPPPPAPSPNQVAALETLRKEVATYESGAKDYRDAVTNIVRLHYEQKKREVLGVLDREISIEKAELRKARENAIRRLEEFIATYTGPRAQPEATPDAMYRLAALYEERARSEDNQEPFEQSLRSSIALYKRIIREFPKYKELAGVYYFLGHAYTDSGRIEEGQQVWRSLVCHNKYPYPTAPDLKNPEKDSIKPLPQDHDEAYWNAWRNKYRDPKSVKRGNAETTFEDPFPESCQALAQPTLKPGEDMKYVAEVWWQIGNWEFDQLDYGSGVTKEDPVSIWGFNRAASAYSLSMRTKKAPLYGVALYKFAWTLFKQQRYEASTREFVRLLVYTDEQQALTGDPGADFRNEAYTYIAGSLTNVDFTGPGAEEPYIQRPDIVDLEPRQDVAEKKLHVAIERVKDPQIIPQDKPWTIDIYKALAAEYRALTQFNNAIEVYELILKKWPMDPTAPEIQQAIADTYDQILATKRSGTPEADEIASKALKARTALANYIGNTPWVNANKDNPTAIQNAERLVRGGLRQAAAQHTNNGRGYLQQAGDSGDAMRQIELLGRAHAEYKMAALGWAGYLEQDRNAPDAYESKYWLADARKQMVSIAIVTRRAQKGDKRGDRFPEPTRKELDEATAAAVDVRDSTEDDKYLENAALFVVAVADVDRDLAYLNYEEGAGDVPERRDVRLDGDGKIVKESIPDVVLRSVAARDDFAKRMPASADSQQNIPKFQEYSAEVFFLYGYTDEAAKRYEILWREHCAKDAYSFRAWQRLVTIANKAGDTKRAEELAKSELEHSCAVSEADRNSGKKTGLEMSQEIAFLRARDKMREAQKSAPGPAREKLWREAAEMYEAALDAAPARDEAPEAAMNAAYCYKQVGEYQKAISLYEKFINEYGREELLAKLQKGDAKAKIAPDPKRYNERLGYLFDAYDALSSTYYGFFNYQRAADTFEKVSANDRFATEKRRGAAKNAMVLYASMNQRDKMANNYRILTKLAPPAEEKANADFLVADFDHKQWSPVADDTGANRAARIAGTAALIAYYNANKASRGAERFALEAAYSIAKMMKAGGDNAYHLWFKNTISAWERFKGVNAKDAILPPYADYAAEADFTLVDEEISAKYDGARHKYSGSVSDVIGESDANGKVIKVGKYQENAKEADKWDRELERVTKAYASVEWVPAAIARRGGIWDTLRTGIYNAVPPAIKFFNAKEEAFLKQLEDSGRDDLAEKADELRAAKRTFWRDKKDRELAGVDELMVKHYASSVAIAKRYNVRNVHVQKATARLAYFTDIIGDAKLKEYVTKTTDPNEPSRKLDYKDGQYPRSRSGLSPQLPSTGVTQSMPVAP